MSIFAGGQRRPHSNTFQVCAKWRPTVSSAFSRDSLHSTWERTTRDRVKGYGFTPNYLVKANLQRWPGLREEEADRLFGFLEGLSSQYVGEDYSRPRDGGAKVLLSDLPMLAKRSFPLCMHNMYSKMLENHHLKHTGRQQFGLFLKSIGLTCDESMAFFKAEFTKKMPGEKFVKDHAYGIRYNYGMDMDLLWYICVCIDIDIDQYYMYICINVYMLYT